MRAIIELIRNTDYRRAALDIARHVNAGVSIVGADHRLGFESARALFSRLTPARIELLDTLHRQGACSVYALAKVAGRNYSNVHSDIAALESLGLIERDAADAVRVPFDTVEIRLDLARVA
jgi:predicted transcriptional regulator